MLNATKRLRVARKAPAEVGCGDFSSSLSVAELGGLLLSFDELL